LTQAAAQIDDANLSAALLGLRAAGGRLAVDDAGSGYTNFRHILDLRPDFIKLDRSFVSHAHSDPARRALVNAVVDFSTEIGARVIAEGVEDRGELRAIRAAGVHLAQGFLFGRPGPLPSTSTVDLGDTHPLRVLVVDDDAVARALVARITRRAGLVVTGQASDGEEAIRLAAQLLPDVVILDLAMPVVSGDQALPQLRSMLPDAHIFVLSANSPYANEGASSSLRDLGADRLILKDAVLHRLPSLLATLASTATATPSPFVS
jgi:CheY-like chemotaxis protein